MPITRRATLQAGVGLGMAALAGRGFAQTGELNLKRIPS